MTDILAPDVVAPFLSSSSTEDAKFQLSTYRGKWVMLLFVRQGQESKIGDFLRQVQLWVNEVEPEWKSYNCHVAVFASSKDVDAELQQLSAVTFVLDEDRSVASSFHCNEENATSNDVATVLIDTEGYIRYTVKNDMAADMKVASNLRVLRALARDGANDDAEEKAQEDVEEAEPAASSSFLSWARTSQSAAAQKSSDLVTEASNLLSYYQWQLRQRPLMTKAITSAIISAAGEALGSWLKGSKQSFVQILRRIGVFFVYGLCIAGPFFHWWYGVLDQYTRALGLPRILTFIIQLALNQLVMTPAMLVVTLAFLQLTHTTSLQSILRNVKNAFAGALYTNWRVWTVAQAINFQVVPLDYRVLFGNVVALWWNIVLSWTTSAPVADN